MTSKIIVSQQAQPTAINFKHGKVGKSSIPTVPANYTCSKRQKSGKSSIPRFMMIYSKQAKKNGKPSLSHVNTINIEKAKPSISLSPTSYCPEKKKKSYIPRKTTKKVEPQSLILYKNHGKPRQNSSSGKSKIPVPTLIKKKCVSAPNSTKKADVKTRRTSHSRSCTICNPSLDTVKKESPSVLRFNSISSAQENQVRILAFNSIKNDDVLSRILTPASTITSTPASTPASIPTSTFTSTLTSTPTSIKKSKSLIPVHKLSNNLFKKRVSPLKPSAPALIKREVLTPISTSNKEANDLMYISLKNKRTFLQESVNINKPEASITISHNKVEISTTIYIIRPELSSISLLSKAEKDLSGTRHQIEGNGETSPTLFGNVFKSIVRFSKGLFSKLL